MKALLITLLAVVAGTTQMKAQSESAHTVKYMVTYEATTKLFTTWVVPGYNLPNVNNGDTEEKGTTAQVTLKVPKGFTMTGLQDIKGDWTKKPLKLGSQAEFVKAGVSTASEYYVIGKTVSETNFGAFVQGEPVALFTFRGEGGSPEAVTVIDANDPFVRLADRDLALNVNSSFYSRSGQAATVQARPLEQFASTITMPSVLAEMTKKLMEAAHNSFRAEPTDDGVVIAYPNPVVETLTLKYFSQQDDAAMRVQVLDMQGVVKQTTQQRVKLGFNTIQVNMASAIGGTYMVQAVVGDKIVTKKIMKQL